jgi:hypothetical protein
MRWTWRITALLVALLAGYTAWPFVDLYRLGRAIERSDGAALSERIEMRALRPSMARQIFAAYLRLTGKDSSLPGFLNGAAFNIAAAMVDRALGNMIEFDQITALLRDALVRSGEGGHGPGASSFVPSDLGGLWTLYAGSEYRLHNFYVSVPPAFPLDRRFRLHLQLTQWTWKLYEVELPQHLRVRLAEMLVKAGEQK